jgi:hypothetical protein
MLQGKSGLASKALGNLLAKGMPLEEANRTLRELDGVMARYAQAGARDEATRLSSPEQALSGLSAGAHEAAGVPAAALDPLLQKAQVLRLMRGETGLAVAQAASELSRLLARPAPTALSALSSGQQVAEQLTSPGRSRVFQRVLSIELQRGVSPAQALRTARQAEQVMALRVPVPERVSALLARHPRAELGVRTDRGEPLPPWLQFDRATGSFVLHDVPPDGPRIRVVLQVAGEQVQLEIGEVNPMPVPPGAVARRP